MILHADDSTQLSAHADSNWGAEPGTQRRSRSGIIARYGKAPEYIISMLQKSIALSSTEEDYLTLSDVCKTITWFRQVLQ